MEDRNLLADIFSIPAPKAPKSSKARLNPEYEYALIELVRDGDGVLMDGDTCHFDTLKEARVARDAAMRCDVYYDDDGVDRLVEAYTIERKRLGTCDIRQFETMCVNSVALGKKQV